MAKIRVGLVGVGKIAQDQHIPVIRANHDFELAACASHGCHVENVANFATVEEMLASCPLDAVAIATPPQAHYEAAKRALLAGKHLLLEKPPCTTITQLDHLRALAKSRNLTFFQTWHLRAAPRVEDAKRWLKRRRVESGRIVWKEDARVWHPGQDWIWKAGGYGVFDPGINAISVLGDIVPEAVFVEKADLFFPENCETPSAAEIVFRTDSGAKIEASLDFLFTGTPAWDIELKTEGGVLKLAAAATQLLIGGQTQEFPPNPDGDYVEYARLYRRFAELIAAGRSEVDASPMRLVADAFLTGRHFKVARIRE